MEDFKSFYNDKTVAVTGASGYLASALIGTLGKTSARIIRVSRKDLTPLEGTALLKADICSNDYWNAIVKQSDIIFHLAGNVSVYAGAEDPVDSLNSTVLPLTYLIEASQKAGRRPRVIFASTATVYGLTKNFPVSEDTKPEPITNYDLHKLFAEKQLELASKKGILEGVSLRLANVYGPSSNVSSSVDRGIFNKIIKAALEGADLSLYGGGNYLRDYVYIDDVVLAFMAAGMSEKVTGQSFNVASGNGITVAKAFNLVAKRVEKAIGRKVHINNKPWPKGADPIEFRNFTADIAKFYNSTGWRPIVSLQDGVDRIIKLLLLNKPVAI